LRQAAGKVLDRSLRGGIGKEDRIRLSGFTEAVSMSGGHVGDHGLSKKEHRVDVHLERHAPFLIADINNVGKGRLMRGVVDQNVDAELS